MDTTEATTAVRGNAAESLTTAPAEATRGVSVSAIFLEAEGRTSRLVDFDDPH